MDLITGIILLVAGLLWGWLLGWHRGHRRGVEVGLRRAEVTNWGGALCPECGGLPWTADGECCHVCEGLKRIPSYVTKAE